MENNNDFNQLSGKAARGKYSVNQSIFTKTGFTLAEVLITLGIIGVVAAMTIPNLIANTRSAQYRSTFKKAVSTLSQAARMSQAQYGFDYAGIDSECGANAATEHPDEVMSVCAILNGTLTGATYYNNASDIKMNKKGASENYSITGSYILDGNWSKISHYRAYVLADGTIVGIYKWMGTTPCTHFGTFKNSAGELSGCLGFIDVNGPSLPNKEVTCSSGSNVLYRDDCIVKNDAQHMTDIYPIRFHDSIVIPASAAARYVLKTAK